MITNAVAQSSNAIIKGSVLDPEEMAVSFANVILLTTADSSIVKVEYTNDDGSFAIPGIEAGTYWLKVSFVGLDTYTSDVFDITEGQNFTVPTIELESNANDLQEVTVTAERPLLELKPNKMVLNVEGSINAQGSNGLELLRKSPGVVVDNNDNITMLGRSGVQIYIDGKPSPLGGADLAAFLRSVQSTEIESIEIITNPSAKYDAAGNAGIINIKMKRDKNLGANANITTGYSQGEFSQYNATVSGNYRDKKMNTFGSVSWSDGRNYNAMNIFRRQSGLEFDGKGRGNQEWENYNLRLGADFFLSKKSTVGFLATGFLNDFTSIENTRTPISMVGSNTIDSVLVASNQSASNRNNYNLNLNYKFDAGNGKTLNIDADYGAFRNDMQQFQPNFYFNSDESSILFERINSFDTPTDIDIYT
ncbi:MAG: TonB-dependent receptor, partial [Bacteroidota bacterium]